jgi:type VI secretion system protein VasD
LPPPAPKPPPRLDIEVKAASNANAGGLPIVVRVYELKSPGAFKSADFFSLYNDEVPTLGDTLVSRQEMTLAPGQSEAIHKELSPGAAYLGVLGAFRNIDSAQWRSVVPLAGDADNSLSVTVGSDAIRIQTL